MPIAGANIESRADEGMWLPSTINKTRIKQMQQRGLKLKAEDLYNENGASLKDAIVPLIGIAIRRCMF